ncbi:MAG: mitochondrial small ribosomal subunit protein uS17m [Candidatus Levybacteria bacterium]|nr:mitochondrial small ribosomal subunit protein uS17m [Candidatus Levybacteria bacterium]
MKRIFDATVISLKMKNTAIVAITRRFPHPLYKKLIKKDNKVAADISTFAPHVGDKVKIAETKPISKTKHFKIMEVIK